MSNVDDNEDGSDEDMFSPKKNRCKIDSAVEQPVIRPPGCKERLVNTFKHMLAGIPPPPDYTNPDFHLDKMLTQWYENQNYAWNDVNNKANGSAERDICTLGLCLNTDDSCEELELLGRQICERYIWNETNAVTSNVYVKLTQSAKKRRKTNGWGLSPRTRISYLTRRMTTFQKDNIAAAVASNKTAQILVAKGDVKKGSAGKSILKGKRALFLSPDNQNKYRTPEQGKDKKVRRLLLNSSPPQSNSSRCSTGGENTKSTEKRRCSRSLFSSKNEEVSDKKSTPQNQPSNALSSQHRQKMLWAVSNALKAVKIRMTDPEFKTYAGPLFKATAEKWRESVNSPAGDKKASTSDAMLAAAKSLVEGVTGRKMSPKSAKKNPTLRMRMKTPDKLGKRDENNPPSIVNPATLIKDSVDTGVFPLEHVDILAEKLDPGGNFNSLSIPVTNPSRKRKLDDEKPIEPTSILLSPRALRMKTPSKSNGLTPKKLTFHPSLVDGTPSKHTNVSPLAKKRKLASHGTPPKLRDEQDMVSPRLLRSRTPLKIPESPEVNCSRSQGVSPMKLRSTPSKKLDHSKNVENSSSSVSTASNFKGEVKGILTPPRVLRTRTPSRAAPSSEVCNTNRTPKKVLFASYDEKEISSKPDELNQSDLEISPVRKTSLTLRTALSLSSNNVDKSKKVETDDDDREAKKLTTNAPKNHAMPILFEDESSADPLPPVLRPEVKTMRRSSRRLSIELPPPVLKMEISDSPPLPTLKR